MDKYIIETNTHDSISKQIKNNKKRIEIFDVELDKFKIISNVTSKIYKLLMKFFYYDNLYIIPIEYFSQIIKDFYKLHFGIYSEEIKKNIYKRKEKKEEVDEEEEEKEEEEKPQEQEQNEQISEEKKEEEREKEEERQLEKELAKKKEDIYYLYYFFMVLNLRKKSQSIANKLFIMYTIYILITEIILEQKKKVVINPQFQQ